MSMRDDERYQEQQQERDQSRSLTTERGGQQDWKGYVQPYRYYGPGYRGVGYYAVFYQGQDASEQDQDQTAEEETQFDQRNVQYGRGQGAGAGWRRGRGRSGRWGEAFWGGRGGQSGQFAGRGPKGYQRSDDRIREDVSDQLTEHAHIDASEIEVDVSGGVVTLTGSVDDRWAKRLAEDIAEGVPGVRDVMNQLRVGGQDDQTGQTGRPGQTGETGSRQTRTSSGGTTEMTSSQEPTETGGSTRQRRNGRRETATTSR
jgi:osmotically-inducible protein OsmY